jgi:hypothetical protein
LGPAIAIAAATPCVCTGFDAPGVPVAAPAELEQARAVTSDTPPATYRRTMISYSHRSALDPQRTEYDSA